MILLLAPLALAVDYATLHVGVHVDAGSVYDIAADGASGQCVVGPSRLSCPARGPVSFRWGGKPAWQLSGDTVVEPGATGTAYVLAPEAARLDARVRLAPESVSGADVRGLFLWDDALREPPPPPSRGMLSDLVRLAVSPDADVRLATVAALRPWVWTSTWGPLPEASPVPIPEGLIDTLSRDPEAAVRRRLASLVRDLRPSRLTDEGALVLERLASDSDRTVRRAAMEALRDVPIGQGTSLVHSWELAFDRVSRPLSEGRAAASTLARLAGRVEPGGSVDPAAAVERTLRYHPERAWAVWTAWRQHVPYRRAWVDQLLRDTLGVSPVLLKYWCAVAADDFAAALTAWEPAPPHSERFEIVRTLLADVQQPAVRAVLDAE